MKLQTPNPLRFNTLANYSGSGSSLVTKVGTAISDHPILFTTDALDLGSGIPTALGAVAGQGGQVLQGTGFAMGVYHSARAVIDLIAGATEADDGMTPKAKHLFTMMAGEGLTATGQFCAAAGVGPVSLGFLGLGLLITNSAGLSQ